MQDLKSVLAALRQEIDAGLDAGRTGRVAVELDVVGCWRDGACRFVVGKSSADGGGEGFQLRLRVEFEGGVGGEDGVGEVASKPAVERNDPGAEAAVFERLCGLFGAPGFDSSARACVFREALEGLSDGEVGLVVARLQGTGAGEVSAAVQRAGELVSRVVRSGPAQSFRRGGEILAAVFARMPAAGVLRLVEERWQSQREWMGR